MVSSAAARRSREATRSRILEATHRLLQRHGYAALSMSDVAREARLSRQGLYLHFPSKVALILALVDRERTAGTPGRAQPDPADPGAPLDRVVETCITRFDAGYVVFHALELASYDDPQAAAAWDEQVASDLALCRAALRFVAHSGRLAEGWSAGSAADLLCSLTSLSVYRLLAVQRGWSRKRVIEHIKRVVRVTFLAGMG